jgi:hypothetical protein
VKKTILIAVPVILIAALGIAIWWKLYRVSLQPAWITADERDHYFYGSVGAGHAAGIPFWIWLAMPRMFPEYLPGPGGYAALGLSWEEGREMPVGFAKQRIGPIRVTGNCALCHVISRRAATLAVPTIIPSALGQTTDIRPLLAFFRRCALDPRFNADDIFAELDSATALSLPDRLLYRYVLIPRTRKALVDPAALLFDPSILAHMRNPKAVVPSMPLPR